MTTGEPSPAKVRLRDVLKQRVFRGRAKFDRVAAVLFGVADYGA
jgi:hypothetical protein